MANCIFCKIIAGEVPCQQVYSDDLVVAFHDIHPVAPIHILAWRVHINHQRLLPEDELWWGLRQRQTPGSRASRTATA
jgi:histidine triad (HIT) family protein